MGKPTQNQHGFNSSPSWSPNEESTFLDMMVEEFINKQPQAMDALIALVVFRISNITDEGWRRVATRLTERIGKKYTMMELKEQMKRFTQRFQCMENLFGQGGPGTSFPRTALEPYSEHENDTRVLRSPDKNVPTPKEDAKKNYGYKVGVQYPEDCARDSNRCSGKVSNQEGGPGVDFHHTEFVPSDEHDSDAGICQSPLRSVLIPEKGFENSDGCNDRVPYREESIRNSNRCYGSDLHPQKDVVDSHRTPNVFYPRECENAEENVEDSGVTPNLSNTRECNAKENVEEDSVVNDNVYHSRELEKETETVRESEGSKSSDAEKNGGSSTKGEYVSSPLVNGESVSQWYDTATGQKENATNSSPRYENYVTKESIRCNKRLAADPLDSSDHKKNKWSSYSEAKTTCGVGQNPDDGDSFSFSRCRNILQGMRRIDSQFRDTALDFLEDPYYRKFFMQMKYDKRLHWLSSILGMKH